MRIEKQTSLVGAAGAQGLTVIIDTFRAFSTACYVMEASPWEYFLVDDSSTAAELASRSPEPLLLGKPEPGADLAYDAPNSPTHVLAHRIEGRTIIHRTSAGARGVLCADGASEVITGSLVNASAVARYVRARRPPIVTLVAMGHEGATPSAEDEIAADCIAAGIRGEPFDLSPHISMLRSGPGSYFFAEAQHEYPREDFARCTAIDRFSFVLRAERFGTYARLVRIDI